MVLNDLVDSFCYSLKNAGLKGLTYFQYEMLFPGLFVFLAGGHRPPTFTAFVLEQVERRNLSVGSQHLERTLLRVLCRFHNTIQIQCHRACKTVASANRKNIHLCRINKQGDCPQAVLSASFGIAIILISNCTAVLMHDSQLQTTNGSLYIAITSTTTNSDHR